MHARYAKSVLIASRPFVCLRCQTRIAAAARRIPARFQHTDAPPSPSSDQLRDVLKKHPSIQGNVQQTFYEHNGGGDSLGWAPLDQKQKSEDSLGVSQASAGPAKETDPSGAASEGGKALVEKPSSSKKQKPSVSRRERGKNHAREKKNTKKRKAAALRQKRSLNHDGAEQGPGVGVQSSEQTSQAASAHDATKSGQKAVKKKKDKLDIQAAEVKKTLQKKANLRKQAQGATQGKPPTIRKQDAKAPVVRKVSALSKDEKLDAKATKGKKNATIESVTASGLKITPIETEQPPVPQLAYGLERVLFNPGVYQLQDPRSRVYNFDPYLQTIMPVAEFDFNALKEYVTSSMDNSLRKLADRQGKRYVGSTSSMTSILAHFHFLLSQWRPINTSMLSKDFPAESKSFTELQRSPSAIFLRWQNGSYAIDADKQFANANVLSMLGKSMEKLLTLETEEYERYRKSNPNQVTEEESSAPESFHYSTMGDFLMRSQLDAHDPRLPGTGMFDLKTRAVVSVRMDVQNFEQGVGYQIKDRQGAYESYEREYYDMIRAAFLKYSMQVRMGRMDGIFVAFHNVERIFGFQYVSLNEMDLTVHGQHDTSLGDQEFTLSLHLLNKILNRAVEKYPKTSLRIHFETREAATPFMYIFAEPVSEAQVTQIQNRNSEKIEEFENRILGLHQSKDNGDEESTDKTDRSEWDDLRANVEDAMDQDELNLNEAPAVTDTKAEERAASTNEDEHSQASNSSTSEESNESLEEDLDGTERRTDVSTHDESQSETEESAEQSQSSDESDPSDAVQGSASNQPEEPDNSAEDAASTQQGLASDPNKGDEDFETEADTSFLEDMDQSLPSPLDGRGKEVLAMTLTLRNKVNGTFVLRPDALKPDDEWSIEYSLVEVPDPRRAWSLYEACQARRQKKLEAPMPQEDADKVNYYIKNLRELSQRGRVWRDQMDESERGKPVRILGKELEEAGVETKEEGQDQDR